MTHREADEQRLDYEQRARAWLAWHIVALDRTKRLPPLNDLLGPAKKTKQPQTWQEQMRIVQKLNAAFGGTVVKAQHA